MLKISLKSKPPFICIVPEKRKEITTEGGLNLKYNKKFLKEIIEKLKRNKSRVSLFIEPSQKAINESNQGQSWVALIRSSALGKSSGVTALE